MSEKIGRISRLKSIFGRLEASSVGDFAAAPESGNAINASMKLTRSGMQRLNDRNRFIVNAKGSNASCTYIAASGKYTSLTVAQLNVFTLTITLWGERAGVHYRSINHSSRIFHPQRG